MACRFGLDLSLARLEVLTCLFGALASGFRLGLNARDFRFALGNDGADGLEEEALEQPNKDKKVDRLQRKC